MNPPKIFISATSGDLGSARQIAKEALLTINCHPVEQTNFEPDWRSVTDMLRGKIGDCQALIHLVGFRYGAEPDPTTLPPGTPRRSYTQMEYHLARELGLRVYTFFLSETYPFDVPAKADTPEQTQLQAAHRALIQSSPHLYEKPANDLDLRTRIIALREQVISLEESYEYRKTQILDRDDLHWGGPQEPENTRIIPDRQDAEVTAIKGEINAPVSTPIDEDVRFTVYRPQQMVPGQWATWLAFAYRDPDDQASASSEEEVQSIANAMLGNAMDTYRPEKQSSSAPLPRESTITIVPQVGGLRFSPESRSFDWHDAVHHEQFVAMAGVESLGKVLRGRVSFFVGALILAEINVHVQVTQSVSVTPSREPSGRDHAKPYRNIFASYSHKDRDIVEHLERLVTVYGDRYLRDVHYLRSGEDWNAGLESMIAQADVFQVFWSNNSMRSHYVRREWEYALSLNRPYFVRPTYWERPFPEDTSQGLPPESLRRLHFQRLPLGTVFGSAPQNGVLLDPSSEARRNCDSSPRTFAMSASRKVNAMLAVFAFMLVSTSLYFLIPERRLPVAKSSPPELHGIPVSESLDEERLKTIQREEELRSKRLMAEQQERDALESKRNAALAKISELERELSTVGQILAETQAAHDAHTKKVDEFLMDHKVAVLALKSADRSAKGTDDEKILAGAAVLVAGLYAVTNSQEIIEVAETITKEAKITADYKVRIEASRKKAATLQSQISELKRNLP